MKTINAKSYATSDPTTRQIIFGGKQTMKHTPTPYEELQEAARQVIWKLSHNHDLPDYKGPGRITREDATIRMLVAALQKAGVSV